MTVSLGVRIEDGIDTETISDVDKNQKSTLAQTLTKRLISACLLNRPGVAGAVIQTPL